MGSSYNVFEPRGLTAALHRPVDQADEPAQLQLLRQDLHTDLAACLDDIIRCDSGVLAVLGEARARVMGGN